jgi:cell surface protein SprA
MASKYRCSVTPISINKIEVWVTNKSNNFTEARNILALQDLGEHEPAIYNQLPQFQETCRIALSAKYLSV